MSNQDRLLSDEELREEVDSLFTIAMMGGSPFNSSEENDKLQQNAYEEAWKLINTQKRLYAERVIGEDEITYANYEDGFFGGKKVTRDKLRAEQRARITTDQSKEVV